MITLQEQLDKKTLNYDEIKGFLAFDEAQALFKHALIQASTGPILEIGSYCGKSTVCLGLACQIEKQALFAIDHHRGSEEHQVGEEYHDAALYDNKYQVFDSFKAFRYNIDKAQLNDTVIPIVSTSYQVAQHWNTQLSMVFIDGGHSFEAALHDYRSWAGKIKTGGLLAIHDIFPNPKDGGQAPYTIWKLAQDSGLFEVLPTVNTLGLLRRIG